MVLCSTYGFFSQSRPGDSRHICYLHTVSYTLLWSYDFRTIITKALIIPREHPQHPGRIYNSFLQTLKYHKDLVDDWRFCSFISSVQLVRWIEGTAGENLVRIQDTEVVTGHGAWHEEDSGLPPTTNKLMQESKSLGFILTALANVVRHACIARVMLHELALLRPSSHMQPPPTQSPNLTSSPQIGDEIAGAVALLLGQVQSGELQAGYLQERGRTQQSVVCHDSGFCFSYC